MSAVKMAQAGDWRGGLLWNPNTGYRPLEVRDPMPDEEMFVGDPPPHAPWRIPMTPQPYTPTITTTGTTSIGPIIPTLEQFNDLRRRVEALERERADDSPSEAEPLRPEDV